MVNYLYQFPKGYESFEKVKQVIEENLPSGCVVELVSEGGAKGFLSKMQEKMSYGFSKGKTLGEIDVKKNAYVGISVLCYSSDGVNNDYISVAEYVPSGVVRFLMNQVLGYVTNLIFPAIYGNPGKVGEEIDKLIMNNFEVKKMDNSVLGSIKGIGKGLGVKESSIKEE
jgi:hypothetical protein